MESSNKNTSDPSPFKIAVVGGGIGGLTLASVLRKAYNIRCTVFEVDETENSRNQGGSLDLHVHSGQFALEKAGLIGEFHKHARYQGEALVITDKTGKVFYQETGGEGPTGTEHDRPEIDRTILRHMLIESLDKDTIQWGKKIMKIEEDIKDNHSHALTFQDGQTESFDFVVGADGAWSKVRKFVSNVNPFYTGIFFAEVCLPNADTDHPAASKLVGHGSFIALQDNKGLLCQRNGDGSIRIYVTIRVEENDVSQVDFSNPENPRKYFLDTFSDWDDSLKVFIKEAPSFIPRGFYMLPTDHTWKSHPGVTLIGDAAHLMSPFAGEGANMAMLDGTKLAAAIAEIVHNGKDLATTIENFEKDMHETVVGPATESAKNMDMFMSDDAPHGVVNFFETMMATIGPPQ